MDIALDTFGDIDVSTGDLVLLDDTDAIKQHLRIRLQFFLGEWFLDTRVGVPYFEQLLGQKPNDEVVRSIMRSVVLSTPGVTEMRDLTIDYDGASRNLAVAFTAVTDTGAILEFDEELIVPLL